ncbi:tRNA (adenosine(37)-N6)-dimethylallyltransferase MiaA [Leptobacterium sp. I13]|uniref:tRNA (adenosine(37)-N6)-dimethylallyltransferase MiaA n=1 Tax=Leptobacterium meishanense TaxID=3128904 RepID=UPI0030ED3013
MISQKYLITVVGPTAIGKTSLAIALAKHYKTVIISADSRQFYREMDIGTAVPTKEELNAAPHYFIQHKSIFDTYTVGDFESDAVALLSELFEKHTVVIMVGGSGLYINAVIKGLDDFPEVSPIVREKLNYQYKAEGIHILQTQLKKLDPEYYKTADIQNPHRVIRALEICIGTNKPFSSFLKKQSKNRMFNSVLVGLTVDRDILYDQINKRVDRMMEEGLLEEVKRLDKYKNLNALQTVGYKELFNHLENKCSLKGAIEEIKKNTRRYAKRQLTWFRKNSAIKWFDHKTDLQNIINDIDCTIKNTPQQIP